MLMTADEFFDWIERQSEPYELVDGMPVRMIAGVSQAHSVATTNIVVALAPSAKTKGLPYDIKRYSGQNRAIRGPIPGCRRRLRPA